MADVAVSNPPLDQEMVTERAAATARRLAKQQAQEKADPFKAELMKSPSWQKIIAARREKEEAANKPAPEARGSEIGGASNLTSDLQRTLARSLTRGGSDYVTSGMSKIPAMLGMKGVGEGGQGYSVEEEQQEGANALARTGGAGEVAQFVGQIAPYFVLPGAATSTGLRTAATMGTAATVDQTARLAMEEGRLPSMKEIGLTFGLGTIAGVTGFYMGKLIQGAHGAKPTISEDTAKVLGDLQKQETAYTDTLTNSQVRVNGNRLHDLAKSMYREIQKNPNWKMSFNTDFTKGGNAEKAREAMNRVNAMTGGSMRAMTGKGDHPTYGYIASEAAIIRDSVKNADKEVVSKPKDVQMVEMIYKKLDDYLTNIATAGPTKGPFRNVWYNKGLDKEVAAYKGLRDLEGLQRKTTISLGILKRAAYREREGTPYDKAVQDEFVQLLTPGKNGKPNPSLSAFTPEEIKAFEGLAKGGRVTHFLNILDHSYGHSVLGHFHRTYSLFTRQGTRKNVEDEVRAAVNLINPSVPKAATDVLPQVGAAGAAAVVPPMVPRMEQELDQMTEGGATPPQ